MCSTPPLYRPVGRKAAPCGFQWLQEWLVHPQRVPCIRPMLHQLILCPTTWPLQWHDAISSTRQLSQYRPKKSDVLMQLATHYHAVPPRSGRHDITAHFTHTCHKDSSLLQLLLPLACYLAIDYLSQGGEFFSRSRLSGALHIKNDSYA